jgi:hypothetical protein
VPGTLFVFLAIAATRVSLIYDHPIAFARTSNAIFSEAGIVIASAAAVEVFDPATGAQRWRVTQTPNPGRTPAVVVADQVIVSMGDDLFAYGLAKGDIRWRVPSVFIISLLPCGDGLVAFARQRPDVATLMVLNPQTGEVRRQRIVRETESMACARDVLLAVHLPNESDGVGYVVTGYQMPALEELWRFRQTGSAEFVEFDRSMFFADIGSLYPIDPKTGKRGAKLPSTLPVDATWGGSTREIETIDDRDTFARVRRNDVMTGKPLWTVDVPFDVVNTLRDEQALYVFGGFGPETDSHFAATIDWKTGALRKVIGPLPRIFEWAKIGRRIVAVTFDGRLIAFEP